MRLTLVRIQPGPNHALGILAITAGVAGWWCNWHTLLTQGEYYPRLSVVGPLGLFGGLLIMLHKQNAPTRKTALIGCAFLTALAAAADHYLLTHYSA
jgi:hypothetical protein